MLRYLLAAALTLVPPVDGPIDRPFDPPARPWAAGHRGVDYRVPPGTPVRAAGDGVVGFAGGVAGGLHVAVDHAGGLRTTYAYLSRIDVRPGQRLRAGDVVGLSGGTGPGHGAGVVHFGIREGARYVDPAALVRPPLRVRLAPVDGESAPPVCKSSTDGRPTGRLHWRPTRLPGREFTRPHSIGDRAPFHGASSGRRPNRGKGEFAWPSSR